MSTPLPARTYNQNHVARKYTPGKRRLSIYWTWSYPCEAQRDPAAMENRFSTMTEVRTVLWPAYETPEWGPAQFLQGIAGTLELFHRSALNFQQLAGEVTGHPVAVFQRVVQARPSAVGGGVHRRRSRGHPPEARARGHLPAARAAPRRRLHR